MTYVGSPVQAQMAFVNPYRAGAENFDHAQRVADDDDRLVGVAQFFELVEALVLEVLVADGQNFVDEQNFGVNIDRQRRKPDAYTYRKSTCGPVRRLK